jgi:hypothetical protein
MPALLSLTSRVLSKVTHLGLFPGGLFSSFVSEWIFIDQAHWLLRNHYLYINPPPQIKKKLEFGEIYQPPSVVFLH